MSRFQLGAKKKKSGGGVPEDFATDQNETWEAAAEEAAAGQAAIAAAPAKKKKWYEEKLGRCYLGYSCADLCCLRSCWGARVDGKVGRVDEALVELMKALGSSLRAR